MKINLGKMGKLNISDSGNGPLEQILKPVNEVIKPVNRIRTIAAGALLLVIGIVLVIVGGVRLHKMNAGKYVEIQATVIQAETRYVRESNNSESEREEYSAKVEYSVDGQTYTGELSTPGRYQEGDALTILYNVDRPTDITLPGTGSSYIMLIIGGIAALAGVIMLLKNLRRAL